MSLRFIAAVVAFGLAIIPATGADLVFTATLRGDKEPTNTGSKATGGARIVVHGDTQTVDVSATVSGITPSDFAKHLAHAPVGPMHLHIYAANGEASLLLPFPMGPEYQAAGDGFTYKRSGYAYAEGAKILSSTITFDDFVTAIGSGAVVFNIHTNAFGDGEISGKVEAVK